MSHSSRRSGEGIGLWVVLGVWGGGGGALWASGVRRVVANSSSSSSSRTHNCIKDIHWLAHEPLIQTFRWIRGFVCVLCVPGVCFGGGGGETRAGGSDNQGARGKQGWGMACEMT
jgi:hypothetical protein